jgi:hypothetical protein
VNAQTPFAGAKIVGKRFLAPRAGLLAFPGRAAINQRDRVKRRKGDATHEQKSTREQDDEQGPDYRTPHNTSELLGFAVSMPRRRCFLTDRRARAPLACKFAFE